MKIENIIFILPAYVANAMPVFIGGELPIDKLLNIKLFGNNKTLLGLLSAFSSGVIVSYIISFYAPYNFNISFIIGLISTIGAIFGDLFGSLIKRRVGIKQGNEFWLDNI
ncbi:MAG: CDP-archaeol synthase, partial [Candidatus Anstonellales archaeon]